MTRFAHGMTVATNALLEGNTARTALLTTAGFEDVIELGRQNRPHLYRLCEPAPQAARGGRAALRGCTSASAPEGVLEPLHPADARELALALAHAGPEAVAICLLHSYADPGHERLLAEQVRELLPGAALSLSSELVGTFREYERTATTVLDASLSPLLSSYLGQLSPQAGEEGLPEPRIMQSSGGLTDVGPGRSPRGADGAVGSRRGRRGAPRSLAGLAGERDVAVLRHGRHLLRRVPDRRRRCRGDRRTPDRAGRPLALPALDIQTVGAGGGSIAWRDAGGALRVGPRSAGARPGPACYGLGGEQPTVTDANLLLGRLPADSPLAGGVHLEPRRPRRGPSPASRRSSTSVRSSCAEGVVRVAEAEMLAALRLVTIERGIDPRGARAAAVWRRGSAARGRARRAARRSRGCCARAHRACSRPSAWPPPRPAATRPVPCS